MIYLFTGDDFEKKKKALDVFLRPTKSGIETIFIDKQDFSPMHLESLYSGESLFASETRVVLIGVLDREESRNFILDHLPEMASSKNTFIFSDGKLKKPILDAFKKSRAEINVFERVLEKKESFNNFLLANALGDRNKLQLWIYFRTAIESGAMMEALLGILHWKLKDMILKKNFQKFTEAELQSMDRKMSYLLPEARRERKDDEAVFEKFLLEAF